MKEAIENLLPYEKNLFFALNGSDSIFLDNMFWTITGRFIWIPVILFLLFISKKGFTQLLFSGTL